MAEECKKLLVLRLEGALQSWGELSKWDSRDSGDFPTKSGIAGLLGCAMGIGREDSRLSRLCESFQMAVRADRPGTKATDFQTITGTPLLTAKGESKKDSKGKPANTIISPRVYLQDACFTVFLDMDNNLRKKIVAALKAPRWCIYLGRKNCVPSRPVLECVEAPYAGLDEALRRYPAAKRAEIRMSYETEIPNSGLASYSRADHIVEGYRSFVRRTVWRGVIVIEEGEHVSVED